MTASEVRLPQHQACNHVTLQALFVLLCSVLYNKSHFVIMPMDLDLL